MRISAKKIKPLVSDLFVKCGLTRDEANISSHCLVLADLAGISTHGIGMLPFHIKRCIEGGYNLRQAISFGSASDRSFSLCDANNSIGFVSAWKAMEHAIKQSEKYGVFTVFVKNANTFSAAYPYIDLAVKKNKIGIVFCNAPAKMAPLGGRDRLIGTNPIAIGIPGDSGDSFILDMATSEVAKSKINDAMINNKKIPYGWATDSYGNPTDDPFIADKGLLLPMAGAKGYGLAIAIDILSGLISGSSYLNDVGGFICNNDCMKVGQTFIAIDPKLIFGGTFYKECSQYFNRIRSSKAAEGKSIFLPGDLNKRRIMENEMNGIEVEEVVFSRIKEAFDNNGIDIRNTIIE